MLSMLVDLYLLVCSDQRFLPVFLCKCAGMNIGCDLQFIMFQEVMELLFPKGGLVGRVNDLIVVIIFSRSSYSKMTS